MFSPYFHVLSPDHLHPECLCCLDVGLVQPDLRLRRHESAFRDLHLLPDKGDPFPKILRSLFLLSPFHVADDLQLSSLFHRYLSFPQFFPRIYFLKMMTAITMIDDTVIPPITASMFLIISTFASPPSIKKLQVVLPKLRHKLIVSVSALELNLCKPF